MLAVRELVTLILAQVYLRRVGEIEINWLGRIAVTPVMAAIFFAMISESLAWNAMLILGVLLESSARSPTSAPESVSLQPPNQNLQVPVEVGPSDL